MLANVKDKWVVTCAIDLMKRTPAGDIGPASGLSFVSGDFVEVEVGVEVIVHRRHRPAQTPKAVDSRLRVTRVTRLFTANEAQVCNQSSAQ